MRKITVLVAAFAMALSMFGTALANHSTNVRITSPADGAVLAANTGTITIEGLLDGNFNDPPGLVVVVSWAGGTQSDSYDGDVAGIANTNNRPWTVSNVPVTNGETYTVTASAQHGSGGTTSDTITFSVDTPQTQRDNPESKEDCDNWAGYGFKNHGQCIRYVANGKDSR